MSKESLIEEAPYLAALRAVTRVKEYEVRAIITAYLKGMVDASTCRDQAYPTTTSEISEHGGDANYWKTRYLLLEQKAKATKPVSIKAGANAVKAVFDLSLVGPDSGFKPEDVAEALAKKWGIPYGD